MSEQTRKQRRRQRQLTQAVYENNPATADLGTGPFDTLDPECIAPWDMPQAGHTSYFRDVVSRLQSALPTPSRGILLLVLLLVGVVLKVFFSGAGWAIFEDAEVPDQLAESSIEQPLQFSEEAQESVEPQTSAQIEIYISGAVVHPGIYDLPPDARIHQALAAAGGPSPGADLNAVNLAEKISDEAHIFIPKIGQIPVESAGSKTGGGKTSAGNSGSSQKVSLNQASAQDLEALSGIGPVLAQRIVDYRKQHGNFSKISQLLAVSGIGPQLLAAISDHLRL